MADLKVTIPEGILLTKDEYLEMLNLQEDYVGKIENLSWFCKRVKCTDRKKVREKILFPNKVELEKFVMFPYTDNGGWKFLVLKTLQWIEENPEKVFV